MTGVASTRLRFFDSIEKRIYRFIGTDPSDEQDWRAYAMAILIFNAIGLAVLLFILLAQGWLFLKLGQYPQAMDSCRKALAMSPDSDKAYFILGLAALEGNAPAVVKESYAKLSALKSLYAPRLLQAISGGNEVH